MDQEMQTPPEQWEWEAHAAGEFRPAVDKLVKSSPAHARRLAKIKKRNAILASMMYRVDCPDQNVLRDFALGMVDLALAQHIRAHAAECTLCARDIKTYLTHIREVEAQFRAAPAQTLSGRLRTVIASLLPAPQTSGHSPAMAVRGNADSVRTEIYTIADLPGWLLTITVGNDDEGHSVRVDLSRDEVISEAPPRIILIPHDNTAVTHHGELNVNGVHIFTDVDAGDYDLIIAIDDLNIKVDTLAVGNQLTR